MKIQAITQQIRIHQWSKNLLLFIPLLAAHEWNNTLAWMNSIIAFSVFCALASSVYIFNDLCDLEKDKAHPHKKHRPLASNKITKSQVTLLAFILMTYATLGTWILSGQFWLWALTYLVINVFYSLKLKSIHSIDVICLASLYALRVMAGSEAANVEVSHWLASFCIFLFLSLALVKRVSELILVPDSHTQKTGRDYLKSDLHTLISLGTGSAYATVLVLILYLKSSEMNALYSSPKVLWFLTPLSIYWLLRIWTLTSRGQVHHDPVLFALKDNVSWLILFLSLTFLVLAT